MRERKIVVGIEIKAIGFRMIFLYQGCPKLDKSELSVREENNLLVENVDKKKFDDVKGKLVDVLAQ